MSAILHTRIIRPVTTMVAGAEIHGTLAVPPDAQGLVIFAHGTGNSRDNPRNQQLADILNGASLATLLCDLLTAEEELLNHVTGEYRYEVGLMSNRLMAVTDWCVAQPELQGLPVGFFAAGTAAAAVFISAAARKDLVRAIVVRGGRLDLAWSYLPLVETPTLLVAGERDTPIRAAYSVSMQRLQSVKKELLVVPRAGHLFQEPGVLEQLGEHAANWFAEHLGVTRGSPVGWTTEVC